MILTFIFYNILRYKFITKQLDENTPTKILQKNLGDRRIETTLNTYTSVFEKFNKDENMIMIN